MGENNLRFPVDIEHSGLRAAVFVTFLMASAGVCGLSFVVFPSAGALAAVVVGLAIGIGAAALIERTLKGRWLSGREVQLDTGGIRLLRAGQQETAIDIGAQVEVLRWCFQTRGKRRVPKGWYVVAVAVASEDATIALYTLMSPEKFEALPDRERFKVLQSEKKTEAQPQDMRMAGEQRRLHEAEAHRWHAGAELVNEAFATTLERIHTLFG